ncbi:MAG: FHA domain-containing serine/threonine-protein kinase [Planctomycetota bacterium]
MPRIVIESGNEKGASLNLIDVNTGLIVGRLDSCALALTDTLISRQHFKITREGGLYNITDLNSHNGTFVNGVKIEKSTVLKEGATIRAGETLFGFHSDNQQHDEGVLIGKQIGGYQLITRIGIGGMGEVYKATQLSLGRQVALKLLSPRLTRDRAFIARFLSEARAAGKFNHKNVVQVHEVGEENGLYYYSMEYLEGGSVHDLVSKGRRLTPLRATEIILQATHALEYAEKVGIVHCDIKPDNLMLTATGEVRLADLGIAKSLNEKGKAEQSDGVFGSPNYMSPEQARGLSLDHRSDLYSLGVTYYRILLGKVPFTGKDAKRIMEKVVFNEPEPVGKIDPTLAPMIYTIMTKLLKKNPADRYQNAAELIQDLEVALCQIHTNVKSGGNTTGPLPRVQSRRVKRVSGRFWGGT